MGKVRIGLHIGNPVREGEDFFGSDVNLAARVTDAAGGGQVLVSSPMKELIAANGRFALDEGRDVELKGLAGMHTVYAVVS
jgi:class 3 adenylate cyclase